MITPAFTYVFAIPAITILASGNLEARWRSLDDGHENGRIGWKWMVDPIPILRQQSELSQRHRKRKFLPSGCSALGLRGTKSSER